MIISNFQRWQEYTDGLSSPNSFIRWGWLYMIGASLQRRVWCGPEHQPCFSNKYVILVAPPGVGKGLVIHHVSDFLKHWKISDQIVNTDGHSQAQKEAAHATAQSDSAQATENEQQSNNKQADLVQPGLIPVAADATTYEALVQAVAESYRRINYINDEGKLKIYGHSSLCFSLQELASLLRSRTNDTVNYMLGLYDNPIDYEYLTKTKGKDRVRRGCLNLLAGTTPSFMQSTFDDKLTNEGFTSRTFFIFAQKNRKEQFWIPALTPEQKEHKKVILEHIRKLTALYGNAKIEPKTAEFLEAWWKTQEKDKTQRSNRSVQLLPYYSRKNIHVIKVAMALHFGESTEMTVPLSAFESAIELLYEDEKSMHLAIILESHNQQAKVAKKILEMLSTGERNFVDICIECHPLIDRPGIEASLEFLRDTKQITTVTRQDEDTGESVLFWRLV